MARDVIKILYIEDDPFDVTILKDTLRSSPELSNDFVVEHAPDLFSGVGMLQTEPFDLVLLDMNLPEGTGEKNVRLIAKHAPGMPIVVLTSMNSDQLAMEAMAAGAQEFVVKGFSNPFIISRVVRSAIFRKSLENEMLDHYQHDALTGLYSECHFRELITEHLKSARELSRRDGLFIIKIMNFNDINLKYGREIAREVCSHFAGLLRFHFEHDLAGVINEGEYGLYHTINRKEDCRLRLKNISKDILESCGGVYDIHRHKIDVNLNIGISSFPEDGSTYDCLFYKACRALNDIQSGRISERTGFALNKPSASHSRSMTEAS